MRRSIIMRRSMWPALGLLAMVCAGCTPPDAEAAVPVNVILAQGSISDLPGGGSTSETNQIVDTSEVVNLGLEWELTPASSTCTGGVGLFANNGLPGDGSQAFMTYVLTEGMAFSDGKAVPPTVRVKSLANTSTAVNCTVDWVLYGTKAL